METIGYFLLATLIGAGLAVYIKFKIVLHEQEKRLEKFKRGKK